MVKLTNYQVVTIKPSAPFAFDPTFHKPDHFPSPDNLWQPGVRWQTFRWQGESLGVKFEDAGSKEKPLIKVTIYSQKKLTKEFIDSLIEEVKWRFNLGLDLKDFYTKFKSDKVLGPITKKWKGLKPGHPSSLYEYLMIGVVLQNATVRRSVQMLQNLFEKFGTLLDFDGQKLYCFWEPGVFSKVSEESLRELKVGYRAKSFKVVDEQFAKGLINEMELREKDMETQSEELIKLYGVGPATVWYLLFDVFHHFNFFNHISPWEQKIYSKVFFNKDPENPIPVDKIMDYFKKFTPYQQLAVHYIWEDLWWKRKNKSVPWLEKLIRL